MGSRIETPPARRIAASTGWKAVRSTCANIAFIGRIALAGMDRCANAQRRQGQASNGRDADSPHTETGTDAASAATDKLLHDIQHRLRQKVVAFEQRRGAAIRGEKKL